jgi:hypothetical protein
MMRTRNSTGLFLLALVLAALAFPPRVTGRDYDPDAPRTLLYGALIGGQLGIAHDSRSGWKPTIAEEILTFGWGRTWGNTGFMVAARAFEVAPSGYDGDYMFAGALAPVYLYAVHGVTGSAFSATPALSAFVGGAYVVLYDMPYIKAGIGAKWRCYVVSPEVLLTWRSLWFGGSTRSDELSLALRLELGGWWRLDPRVDRDE